MGRPGNAILGEETRIVYGAECMRDQLLGCEFDISPTAFYQTNPQQTELLYQLAIDGMDLQQGNILMDAYCGSGTIGLCAAKDAQDRGVGIMLLGVERNPGGHCRRTSQCRAQRPHPQRLVYGRRRHRLHPGRRR